MNKKGLIRTRAVRRTDIRFSIATKSVVHPALAGIWITVPAGKPSLCGLGSVMAGEFSGLFGDDFATVRTGRGEMDGKCEPEHGHAGLIVGRE